MMFGTLVAEGALEGGVQAIAAVIDWPDRELVRNGAWLLWGGGPQGQELAHPQPGERRR
jgi:hypothetical protein